jgi:hypothetical protein
VTDLAQIEGLRVLRCSWPIAIDSAIEAIYPKVDH